MREARCADPVIIGQQTQGRYDNYRFLDPSEVLLKLGRPALLIAPGIATLRAEHVVVASKDTRAAQPESMTSSVIWRGTRSPPILGRFFIVTGLTRTICSSLRWTKEPTCWWQRLRPQPVG